MLKKLRVLAVIILLIGLIPIGQVVFASTQAAPAGATAIVNPTNVYVSSFEGWGTSLVWFANVTGGWSDANRTALADLIYGSSGLQLNIARYNIGGSQASQAGMRPGGLVRSYINSSGVYDWTVDANQRWWLSAAIARGANITEAFSNSPPWYMTISGDTRGASGCGDNLQSSQNAAFADYLTEVVKHFRDSWGVTFRTLDPLNEPMGTWWCITGRQEGAHIGRPQQSTLVELVGASLASKGLTGTTVSAPDETSPGDSTASINSYSTAAKNYLGQLNAHTYGGNSTDKTNFYNLGVSMGKRVWMSEIDGSAGTHNHNDIAPGMWLAARITEDINYIKPAAWIHWQVIEDEANMISENQNWGVIHASMTSGETWYTTKKYYVMGNYTKFIRPGYQIIASGDAKSVAAYNASTSTLVIVSYNNTTSAVSMTYNLTNFTNAAGPATPRRTSASENLVTLSNITVTSKSFSTSLPANSVTTFVITGVSGTGPTVTPAPTATPGSYYQITNRNSGKVADVNGQSTANGAVIDQWTWDGGTNQQWEFQDAGSGYYRVVGRQSGKCMDVTSASTADGATIKLYTCGTGTNQQWQWVATGSYFNLKARHSGKCANIVGSSTADGATLEQRTCGTGNSFQWSRQ